MRRSRRAVMWLKVGGEFMMASKATSNLAEGRQSTAGEGAGIAQGNA
jgi:hypothetical protein